MAYVNHEPAPGAEADPIARALPEPPSGTVLSFVKTYNKVDYTYVAIRAGVNWYVTGSGTRYTWDELKCFANPYAPDSVEFTYYAPTEGPSHADQ